MAGLGEQQEPTALSIRVILSTIPNWEDADKPSIEKLAVKKSSYFSVDKLRTMQ